MTNLGIEPIYLFLTIIIYFLLLVGISWYVNRKNQNNENNFFAASTKSPWYLIAFGTLGGSLSGVTFVSVPGNVSTSGVNEQFAYLQIVMGYILGYAAIAWVLLPIYYRMNLVSIYTYLEDRFGRFTYKTGSSFFLLSRSIGTAFRLFLTTMVLHTFIFSAFGIPFWATVAGILILIYIYTYKGGIQTIVWTDAIQTTFMLGSLIFAVYTLCNVLEIDFNAASIWASIEQADMGQIFYFENGWSDPNNFFKQFFSGAFITIVMTGLDQDMMQKNLTCRSLKDAQKNVMVFSVVVFFVNFIFLVLGGLLAIYAQEINLQVAPDKLFPAIALEYFTPIGGLMFIIGLIAAAYASTDSALTALTTAFCIDILGFEAKNTNASAVAQASGEALNEKTKTELPFPKKERNTATLRKWVHVGFVLFVFVQILAFWYINDSSVINALFTLAGYTYGPLLGLYSFGIFTKWQVKDKWVPLVCILSPVLTYVLNLNSEAWFWGYKFSFELLIINGLITFLGLLLIRQKE